MRKVAFLVFVTLFPPATLAELLSCEELMAKVDAKLQAKGVPTYTLEFETVTDNLATSAVPSTRYLKGKEVGACDGGKKRLIYTRGN